MHPFPYSLIKQHSPEVTFLEPLFLGAASVWSGLPQQRRPVYTGPNLWRQHLFSKKFFAGPKHLLRCFQRRPPKWHPSPAIASLKTKFSSLRYPPEPRYRRKDALHRHFRKYRYTAAPFPEHVTLHHAVKAHWQNRGCHDYERIGTPSSDKSDVCHIRMKKTPPLHYPKERGL